MDKDVKKAKEINKFIAVGIYRPYFFVKILSKKTIRCCILYGVDGTCFPLSNGFSCNLLNINVAIS